MSTPLIPTATPFKPSVPAPTYNGPINNSINNTQQGADLVNSNQQQAAKMGITIPGSTQTAAPQSITDNLNTNLGGASTKDTTGKNVSGTASSATTPTLADQTDRDAMAKATADYQAQAQQVQDTITNIQNGTTPLTAGEQAQVDGLKGQFQTLIDAQALQNTGATGLAQVRGFQVGAAEYDPFFQAKTIGSIVSAGQAKVADLQTKEASAVAALTQSFHDNDIKAVQNAWQIYQDAYKARTDALQQTIKDTQDAIASAQTEADKQQAYEFDVAKFNQTGDQNSFDNALKAEQQKFAEAQKTSSDAETARHDRATEAISAFNAGMGAGGGGGVSNNISSASLGAAGPDPASQKQVFDQISAQYGPMTATAIKSLANYEMNPGDWSTRSAKGGMTREQAVTLAKMYDPTYNDAQYSIRAGYMKNLASSQTGTVGSAVNAANKSINHLTAYVNTMEQLHNSPSSLLNKFNLATLGNVNPVARQAKAAATTEGLGVAEELAKFFKGSGTVDVASIDAWKSQLNTSATPADVHGLTQGAITLLAGQLETLSEQYTATMGKAPSTDFLNSSARASLSSLKNQGYDVPIDGILYTDKDAYLKNGGSMENLSNAYQVLVNAKDPNNPPTQENVLELAQLQ